MPSLRPKKHITLNRLHNVNTGKPLTIKRPLNMSTTDLKPFRTSARRAGREMRESISS